MNRDNYIPREERKTILWMSDDLRAPSGIGTMTKEIIEGTCHHYNYINLGAGIKHPDNGKVIDISAEVADKTGVEDASVIVIPNDGYGDSLLVRGLIERFHPDAIMHFTDPRYWTWLYNMEHEIHQMGIPIMFYTIWDDTPYPMYNADFYRSCDWLGCISKQTYNIVKQVRDKVGDPLKPWQLDYVPHGINPEKFYPISSDDTEGQENIDKIRTTLFGKDKDTVNFSLLYSSRNIRRKMTSDLILAFNEFLTMIPEEERDNCRLVLHTDPVDQNGTDLIRVFKDLAPDVKYVFSKDRVDQTILNCLYNTVDVLASISSNEGFGLTVAEALMTETPVIVNVTGGLQDQCGFVDDNGELLDPEKHFNYDWGTNADGRYKQHGKWVFPVWPKTRSIVGSPQTPYIFDDRCDWKDVAKQIYEVWKLTPRQRKNRGKAGREYCLGAGNLNAEYMCNKFIEGIETTLENITIPPRWEVYPR